MDSVGQSKDGASLAASKIYQLTMKLFIQASDSKEPTFPQNIPGKSTKPTMFFFKRSHFLAGGRYMCFHPELL